MRQKPIARMTAIGLGMAPTPHLDALAELRGRVDVSGRLSVVARSILL